MSARLSDALGEYIDKLLAHEADLRAELATISAAHDRLKRTLANLVQADDGVEVIGETELAGLRSEAAEASKLRGELREALAERDEARGRLVAVADLLPIVEDRAVAKLEAREERVVVLAERRGWEAGMKEARMICRDVVEQYRDGKLRLGDWTANEVERRILDAQPPTPSASPPEATAGDDGKGEVSW